MKNNGFNQSKQSKNYLLWALIILLLCALFFGWGGKLSIAFYALLLGATPIFMASIIAFLFYRLIDKIEQKMLKNAFSNTKQPQKYKRIISLTIVTIIILLIVASILYLFIPRIIEIIKELVENSDTYLIKIKEQLSGFVSRVWGSDISESVKNFIDGIYVSIRNTFEKSLPKLLEISTSVISFVFVSIISILLSVLILKDKEKISSFCYRFLYVHKPKDKADEIVLMSKRSDNILFNYFISKFIEVAILSVLTGIAYFIMGVPYAWELAVLISVFNFIPYVGVFIGLVPILLITIIFSTITTAIYVAIVTAVIFAIVTGFVTPFIIGFKIKMSGLMVGCSIIIGGAVFGVAGMLFAPPIVAIVSLIVNENLQLKEQNNQLLINKNLNKGIKGKQDAKQKDSL